MGQVRARISSGSMSTGSSRIMADLTCFSSSGGIPVLDSGGILGTLSPNFPSIAWNLFDILLSIAFRVIHICIVE